MPYTINGQTASLAPYQQSWQDIVLGTDHTGRPVYAATKSARLEFDACTYASYQQWAAFNGASLTSIQLLSLDTGSFVSYSNAGIFLQIGRPTFEAGYLGRWSALINGIAVT